MTTGLPLYLSDFARVAHLLTFVAGFGVAMAADALYLASSQEGLTRERFGLLLRAHDLASWALAGLWITGILLVYDLTRFDPERFTPKLVMKIGAVTLLTANALLIKEYVLPIMREWGRRPFRRIPFRLRLGLTLAGIVSTTCWLASLTLGATRSVRSMDFNQLFPLLALAAGGAALGAFLLLWTPLPRLLARVLQPGGRA
ncbi:hypothetical protein [Neomegalonema sp.]|uniref:hypothetical protein n=1 Tax=Neomegalonema sp. TaxID=2039713 RepID=UPI00263939BE|nr:hypothetical protein [Neomegalonema sp.]MDD2867193.1 hypothetical protein [Neomegalonema sp.]